MHFHRFIFVIFLFLSSGQDAFGAIKVGLVLDKGGKDDKSFNASAYKGAREAQSNLGVELKVVESSDDTALEPSLRTFAQKGYDLVIGIGFVQGEPVQKVAAEFPKIHFLIVDSKLDLPNVRSVIFNEHEGSFLVGVIAGLTTKSKVVGFVGGMDIPLIRRFELGFRTGAQSVNNSIRVLSQYVGSTSDAWKNPTKGKELALSQYQKNADIIFTAAGASGLGVFDAAEEKQRFAIGVDSNQNWVKPGRILTSMLKRVDLAVYEAIESKVKNSFKPGAHSLGIREGAIDYALDEHNRAILTAEVQEKVESIKTKLLKNQIHVPDYYVEMKKTRQG